MASWLTKASTVLKRRTPDVPVLFEITCPCGQTIRGVRRSSFQRALCKGCGEPFFILPKDVYPQWKTELKKSRKKTKRKAEAAVKEQPTLSEASVGTAADLEPRPADDVKAPTVDKAKPATPEPPKEAPQVVGNKLQVRRHRHRRMAVFTPFRLVVLSIVAVIVATGFWLLHFATIDDAREQLPILVQNGYAALEADDWVQAAEEFEKACDALDKIGRDDAYARKICQLWHETTAARDLAGATLYEILSQAQEAIDHGGREDWQQQFTVYRDTWIVMQTTVITTVDSNGNSHYLIECPLIVNETAVMFDADLAVRKALGEKIAPQEEPRSDQWRLDPSLREKDRREMIFAAQLEDCRISTAEPKQWIVQLRGDTAFLWSNLDNLRKLGLEPDELNPQEKLQQLLDEQTRKIGAEL